VPGRRNRAFEDVLAQIRTAIQDGYLKPGDRLPTERDLADSLSVSRTSVREAIRVLEAFGIVKVRVGAGPEQGVTISTHPGDELVDLFAIWTALQHIRLEHLIQFREAIEGWACSKADPGYLSADGVTAALENLEELTRRMRQTKSKDAYLELDTAFHIEVVRFAGNPLASIVISAVRGSIKSHMLAAFERIDHWDEERQLLTAEHTALAQLLRQGEANLAREAVTQHVRRFYSTYVQELESF
jgi:DNA-binding FadR family transcriptional regulator